MPTPPLFHGIDITPLEGWMTKYKSKGKFFGTSNKRWFKVNVATDDNASHIQRLTLSYFKSKKATEVRGWIYLEDVTEISNKADVIEIVSPTRTLRLKGETVAEHRMWLESLRQLCFPQQPSPPRESAKQIDSTEGHLSSKPTPSLDRAESQSKASVPDPLEEAPAYVAYASARSDPLPEAKARPSEAKLQAKQPSTGNLTTEAAVKQHEEVPPARAETKSVSEEVAEVKPPLKPRGSVLDLLPRDESQNALQFSDSDDSDDEDGNDAKASGKQSEGAEQEQYTAATSATSPHDASPPHDTASVTDERDVNSFQGSNNSFTDAKQLDEHEDATEVQRFEPSPTRPTPNSDYFDDDVADSPKKPASPPKPAPSSTVRADNNFVTEDWDDDDQPVVAKAAAAPSKAPPQAGVAADANFVTEDWD